MRPLVPGIVLAWQFHSSAWIGQIDIQNGILSEFGKTSMQLAPQDLRTQAVQTLDSEFNIMEVVVSSLEVIHWSFILSYCSQSFAPCYLHACMHA